MVLTMNLWVAWKQLDVDEYSWAQFYTDEYARQIRTGRSSLGIAETYQQMTYDDLNSAMQMPM